LVRLASNGGHRAAFAAQFLQILRRQREIDPARVNDAWQDDPLLVADREWAQQHGVGDGEHRDRHPDSETKDQHCRRGERWRTAEAAEGDANIFSEANHRVAPPLTRPRHVATSPPPPPPPGPPPPTVPPPPPPTTPAGPAGPVRRAKGGP